MKIAIDCRYFGRSGIGRVCKGAVDALGFRENEYYLIGKKEQLGGYPAIVIEDPTDPYSFAGLRSFDRALNKICDAYFTPNFLIPFGVRIPVHAVMHDLAFLDVRETTRGALDKAVKRTLLARCMKKAATVACDSAFTRSRCLFYYGKRAEKCYVNYIGLSASVLAYAEARPETPKQDKIVFVGNVKPHKGLPVLLDAFSRVGGGTVLKIIGERENFRLGLSLDKLPANVVFTGKLDDEELFGEIASAKYLVLPSRYEGFGLPPLEALLLGTQPIVSDLEVFHEVYAGLPVLYFSDGNDLAEKLLVPPAAVNCKEEIAARYDFAAFDRKLLGKIAAYGASGA